MDEITCRYCDGEGKIARANSEATYDCPDCDGRGVVDPGDCPDCDGERVVHGDGPDGLEPCPTCTH
jgi:DnaJ-class molecular chaperone